MQKMKANVFHGPRDKKQPRSRLRARQAMPENQYVQGHHRDHRESITYSILFTSFSIVSTINAGVTPTVAPTSAFLVMKIRITFCCDRNVTRILGRRFYTWSDTAGIEVFIHC
jgi:hypothetical protein